MRIKQHRTQLWNKIELEGTPVEIEKVRSQISTEMRKIRRI